MKKGTLSIIIGILLIGIVSASLITHFAIITGSVEVKGLVFYPDSHIAEKYYNLRINEVPDEEELTLIDGENIIFETSPLEINEFYEADYTVYMRIKTNVEGNKLWAELWVLDGDENYKEMICDNPLIFDIGATTNFWTYDQTCHGEELNYDEEDRLALRIYGAGQTSNYTLRVGDYTDESKISRIEVSAT
ncbi:MAG: hypothetical protein KKF68_02860 [Nanoarchaeota archaeon]|nr:hypothetical protein [Nanoarchaeota archaeon]